MRRFSVKEHIVFFASLELHFVCCNAKQSITSFVSGCPTYSLWGRRYDCMAASVVLDPSRPLKRVYDAHIQHYNVSNESLPEYHAVRTSLQRVRSRMVTPIPRNLEKLKLMTNGQKLGQERGFWAQLTTTGALQYSQHQTLQGTAEMLWNLHRRHVQDLSFAILPVSNDSWALPWKGFTTCHVLAGWEASRPLQRSILQYVRRQVRACTGHLLQPRDVLSYATSSTHSFLLCKPSFLLHPFQDAILPLLSKLAAQNYQIGAVRCISASCSLE